MDDGNKDMSKEDNASFRSSPRVRLSTEGFKNNEVYKLSDWLRQKGFINSVGPSTGGLKIRINSSTSQKFFKMVAPYVLKEFDYKLPIKFRTIPKVEWWKDTKLKTDVFPSYIVYKKLCKEVKQKNSGNDVAFDLGIEDTHCYFANNILVHNCHDVGGDYGERSFSEATNTYPLTRLLHSSDADASCIEYYNLEEIE